MARFFAPTGVYMKILILMRHGKAEAYAETEETRPLTAAGREKARLCGLKLKEAGLKPDLLLCSPLLRARQTAQIVGEALGAPPQTAQELDGRLSAKGLIDFALAHLQKSNCLLLVGHNPNVSLAAGILREEYTPFEAGACAVFDMTDPNRPKTISLESK